MNTKTGSAPEFNALSAQGQSVAPVFLPTPFRKALHYVEDKPAPELQQIFADGGGLLYEQSVTSYLNAFCVNEQNMSGVLGKLRQTWNRFGFLPIDDLTQQMLKQSATDLPTGAIDILHKQIENRYRAPEPLTKYDRKQHAPLTIGLGHLYAVLTDRPAALVVMDDINLGGMIEHVDKLMAIRDGRAPGQTGEGSPAYQMADKILTVVAGISSQSVEDGMRETRRMASLAKYRTGGDEKAFFITGLEEDAIRQIVDERAVPAVEVFMACLGLMRHEYPKDRNNPMRAGSGTAFAHFMLTRTTNPGVALVLADDALGEHKKELGMDRRGCISTEYMAGLNAHTAPAGYGNRLMTEGVVEDAASLTQNDLDNLYRLESAHQRARTAGRRHEQFNMLASETGAKHERAAQALDQERAITNPHTGEVEWTSTRNVAPYAHMKPEEAGRVLAAMEAVLAQPKYARFLTKDAPALHVPRSPERQNLLFATPIELDALRFNHNAQRENLQLAPQQTQLCHTLLGSFSPTDHATGTLIKDVMPELFGRFAQDTATLRTYMQENPALLAHSPSKKVRSFAVAASMLNLAGVNKLLGSDNANLVLHHFAHNIVGESFTANGIEPEYREKGHEGGGHIVVLPRPVVQKGSHLHCVSENIINKVEANMAKRMRAWRRMNITDFLVDNGGTVPEGLDAKMTFGDIVDPKRSARGINISTVHIELHPTDEQGHPVTGGRLRNQLATLRDQKIDQLRAGTKTHRVNPANLPA